MDGTEPGVFELGPCFPDASEREPLLERAAALVAEGHRLEAVNAPLARLLRPLLVTMNACHESEIDGRPLHPMDVESPLANAAAIRTGPEAALARARAHVAAELALSAALPQRSVGLYAPEFVQCIHAELHRRPASSTAAPASACVALPEDVPGAWRRLPVAAARGAPPEAIPEWLDHWQGVYSKPATPAARVVGALCAGQRLLAVRPFDQGSGRTARLHTLLVLGALGVTQGLWSPLRGMAEDRDGYRQALRRLIAAPPARENETARREALGAYATWLLDACLADARVARERLDPKRLEHRLLELLGWLAARPWVIGSERSVIKPDALEALHYAALTGPVERARFIAMLGLQHRTGRRVLSSLIDCGLLVSDSSRAPVRFSLPWPSLRFLFPDMWPEGASNDDADAASRWPADARASGSGTHSIALEAHADVESRSAAG